MSVKAMTAVWEHSTSSGSARLVLLAIADCANDEGTAWPSMATIAAKANVDRRTVSRCVAELEAAGDLERVHRGGRLVRGGKSNHYRLTVTQGQDAPTSTDPDVEAPCPRDTSPPGAPDPEVGTSRPELGAPRPPNRKNPRTTTSARKRATPPPDDFEVTNELREHATAKGWTINLETETERFLDFHRAKGSKFRDWHAAWRNWMSKAQEYAKRDGTLPGSGVNASALNPRGEQYR